MNVATLNFTYENIPGMANTVGFSGDSDSLRSSLEKARDHFMGPIVLGEKLRGAIEKLVKIYELCAHEDWDGNGEKGVSISALSEAIKLFQLFPPAIPMPHISPEPSGGIALEWYKDKSHVFIATLSGIGVITFAGLYGVGNQLRGTVYFGDSLPGVLVGNIKLTVGV